MELDKLIDRYKKLGISDVIDHERFNLISIVHHSTKIEGSTLTEIETQVLINEGLTPKGKPLIHSLMVTDHFSALQFVLREADKKVEVSIKLIQEINSYVVKNTGQIYQTIFGEVDATKGQFRKGNVSAGNTYFPNYDKVISLKNAFVKKVNEEHIKQLSIEEIINLSFDCHYNLVSIHPFYDGNGRTSRLLMNFIQAYYKLPLAIVYDDSKTEYIQALIDTREKNDINIFRNFMKSQYERLLTIEIKKFEEIIKPGKGKDFRLLF